MLKDRVQETSTTTGTGNFTLAGAVPGFQTFATAFPTASEPFFYIITQDNNTWEAGVGSLLAGALVRTAPNVLAGSSGASTLVPFAAGTKYVFNSAPADRYTDWRGALLKRPAMQNYTEVVTALGTTATIAMDLSLGNVFTAQKPGGATTVSFTNVPATASRAVSVTLILTNGGNGTAISWTGATYKWSYNVIPTLQNGGVDILTFFTVDAGTSWHAMLASADSR